MNNNFDLSQITQSLVVRNYHNAYWQYEKIVEAIKEYEESLDDQHEVALMLASFGASITMAVTNVGYYNPDILCFYGYVNGKESQLIQHISQLNVLLTSVEKADPVKPPRRIGFALSEDADE